MKISTKLRIFFCICLTILLITSCEDEPVEEKEQPVQFSFSNENLSKSGRIADISDARAILVSITNSSGETILNMEEIVLYNLSNESNDSNKFVSEPVSLKPGDYNLTDFLVVNEDDAVIYVTPKEGSEKSHLVGDPLPIQFSVTADNVNEIAVQVVDATTAAVESFGYATFAIDEVNAFKFRMQASITVYQNEYEYFTSLEEFTDARVEVYQDSDMDKKLFDGIISPDNDLIEIADRDQDAYYITITKPFYETYEKSFTREALVSAQEDPIKVMLENKAKFTHILSSEEAIISQLVPPGDHSKLLYITAEGLFKMDISDLNNPGSPVFIGEFTGYLSVDYFGTLYLADHYSTDDGETWTAITEETPRAFAEIDGTYYGRIGTKLYGRSENGDWQLLSELPPYTGVTAYQGRLFTTPSYGYSEKFYVTKDGINMEEIPSHTLEASNYIFIGGDKLFLNTSHEGLGYIVVWDGSSWTLDNTIYEWDPEINGHFFIAGYKKNLLLVEGNRVKVLQLKNCSPGTCNPQTLAAHVPQHDVPTFPTISGRHLAGDMLFLETFTDKNGNVHLYAMDLSRLELE